MSTNTSLVISPANSSTSPVNSPISVEIPHSAITTLHIYQYPEHDTSALLLETSTELSRINDVISQIGASLQKWPLRDGVGVAQNSEEILAAYQSDIDAAQKQFGYQSFDVVRLTPTHPQKEAMRHKFLFEHTHAEDEVRFFAAGSGVFYLHVPASSRRDHGTIDLILALTCTAGDWLRVPAGTKHWFDMGPSPSFVAVRLFSNPDGWIAIATGDDVAKQIPLYAGLPAGFAGDAA